jgi:hypothetical protein
MKNYNLFLVLLFIALVHSEVHAQVGVNTTTFRESVMFQVESDTAAIGLPRGDIRNVTTPSAGSIFYNTAKGGGYTPGYYGADGTSFRRLPYENTNVTQRFQKLGNPFTVTSISPNTDTIVGGSVGNGVTSSGDKNGVEICLSASGYGYTQSSARIIFIIIDTTSSEEIVSIHEDFESDGDISKAKAWNVHLTYPLNIPLDIQREYQVDVTIVELSTTNTTPSYATILPDTRGHHFTITLDE